MALIQMQGVQIALCEFTILQLLSLKKMILFKRYLFFYWLSLSLFGGICG